MGDLCHDLVGLEPRKRRAEEVPEEHRALLDRTAAACVCAGGKGGGLLGAGRAPGPPRTLQGFW